MRKRNPLPVVHLSNGHSYTPVLVVCDDGQGWYLFKGEPGKSTGVRDDPNHDFRTRRAAVAHGVKVYGVKAISETKWLNMSARNPIPRKRKARKPMSATARREFAARMAAARARRKGGVTRKSIRAMSRQYQIAEERKTKRYGNPHGKRATNPAHGFQIAVLRLGKVRFLAGVGLTDNRDAAANYRSIAAARKSAGHVRPYIGRAGIQKVAVVSSGDSLGAIREFLTGKQ